VFVIQKILRGYLKPLTFPKIQSILTMKKTLLFLFLTVQLVAQTAKSLPRSTPEAEGVAAEGISNFIEAIAKSKHEMHSLMVLRHGKVIAEGWWSPYRSDLKHTMYSCSKSFTATAIGFAVSEKRLTVDDKVIAFFPNDLPDTVSENLKNLRVKDLLSMSVGQTFDATGPVVISDNWVKTFFKIPIVHAPGSKFLYNSAATYMLAAIVQKLTGEKVIDYLKPRLFDPLSIEGIDWEIDPQGVNVGGWGLRLKTEDMAKFGQLFLQKGKWQGKQILPAAWVEEASTLKIMQDPNAQQTKKDSSDWLQGYCYQMWRSRHNSYRGDGAFGQYILVLPEHDAVIAITSETADMQAELNLVWEHILPAFSDKKTRTDPNFKTKLTNLTLNTPLSKTTSNLENTLSGKSFSVVANDNGLKNIQFAFQNNICSLILKGEQTHTLTFASGNWAMSETTRFGPYLVARAQANRSNLPPFKIAGNYIWKDDNTLELTLRYIESPHTETMACRFNGDSITIDFQHLMNHNEKRKLLKAVQNNNNINTANTTATHLTYITESNINYYPTAINQKDAYTAAQCRLDIYYPTNTKNFATIIWFHGGGLTGGSREIPKDLTEKGYAVVGVGYRLSPKVRVPDCIEDAAAAIAWVFKNIEKYGGNPNLIIVSGHSAGGYLATMVGLDKSYLSKYGIDANKIAGLMPFSGQAITHFTLRQEKGIKPTQPVVDQYAPMYHVRADAPPMIIISGDRELELYGRYEENAYFCRMMQLSGHKRTKIYELDGFDHGGMVAPAMPLLLKEVAALRKEVLGEK
jgi:CubicO group peptidase (beta-lactamase class C family)